jgi:hypothetical protein
MPEKFEKVTTIFSDFITKVEIGRVDFTRMKKLP